MRSLARIGFERLLEMYAGFDIVRVEWQYDGPWVLVDLGQPSESNALRPASPFSPDAFAIHPFAILKHTGAVYGITDGAVHDDPLISV
jgi:hypothetical protein